MTKGGAPLPAQIQLYTGARSRVIEGAYSLLGRGLTSESNTFAALEAAAAIAILGDGTTANPGLGSAKWQQLVADLLRSAAASARYDIVFAREARLLSVLDDLVQAALPAGWRFSSPRSFDGFLTRLNGARGAPATPSGYAPGVLNAVNSAAGALPSCSAGSAPRVVHTLVGASDEFETLPTSEAMQTAIAGSANGYRYQIAGTVPAGITKVRVYRTGFGASGAPYFWDQDVSVTSDSVYSAIAIQQPDSQLRSDLMPPSWMQCAVRPGAAALYALAFASAAGGSGGMALSPNGMISPGNVLLASANGFIGIGNPPQSALFGQSLLTGVGSSTYTPGAIAMVNNSATGLQGFAGAVGIRARVVSALNGTLTPTITINYCSAAGGWSVTESTAGLTPSTGFSTGAVGDTAIFTLPAGQIVQSLAETGVAGTASAGAWVYEAT